MSFPEIAQQQEQQRAQAMQQIQGFLNPYVQMIQDAAGQQAKILRGMLGQVPSRYRPVLSSYLGANQQMASQQAAAQALSAMSGGVGFPELVPQKGGSDIASLLSTLGQQGG